MARKYRQFCAVARALDTVGERWTLLIVRELLLGPRRYGELREALPGIGTNLLADRLAAMREEGICRRAGRYYELAPRGRTLEEAVLALARWGMSPMEPPAGERMRPDWYAVAMLAAYRTPARVGPDEAYEFEIDGATLHLAVNAGVPRARRGAIEKPAFRLASDLVTFLAIATRAMPATAVDPEGDLAAVERWLDAFSLPAPTPLARPVG